MKAVKVVKKLAENSLMQSGTYTEFSMVTFEQKSSEGQRFHCGILRKNSDLVQVRLGCCYWSLDGFFAPLNPLEKNQKRILLVSLLTGFPSPVSLLHLFSC